MSEKIAKEYLRHVLEEVKFVLARVENLNEESFVKDEVLKRAIVRSLEIVGEAIKNLPDDYRNKHSEIDWKSLAGLRDKLIHHYFGVDYGIVWDVAVKELPELKEKLEKILVEDQI